MTKLRTSEVTKKLKILRFWTKIAASPLPAYCSWTRAAKNVGMVPFGRSFSVESDWYKFFKKFEEKWSNNELPKLLQIWRYWDVDQKLQKL